MSKEFEAARKGGFVRVRVDGILYDLSETIKLEKNKKHTIEIVVDRLVIKPDIRSRLADSMETAASLDRRNLVVIMCIGGEDIYLFSELRLPGTRHQHRGADAADVFL